MLICSSDIFCSTNVIVGTSFHFKTLFSTQPINLVIEEISRNKSAVQTPITYFIHQKEKRLLIPHSSTLTFMKSEAPFFRTDIIYMICLDVLFSSWSQYSYNDGTFPRKVVKLLSIRHNLSITCMKMPVFETH